MLMINGFGHLYSATEQHIAKIREIKTIGFVDSNELSKVTNRAVQLCVLDLLLAAHRNKHETTINKLPGAKALHHKLLQKYNWPLSEIRAMSLSDVFIALHDELSLESLEGQAKSYFSTMIAGRYPITFTDFIDDEWDPDLAEKLLFDSAQ
ncbi:hypothetical protein [Enterobacter hormaechei]|nr:hypothetical protein [Enterobacter hormaechei]MCM8068336.1 hypothetical protein [Enterobacter hormaechei]MCM8114351.1 hypothetical protein [Enterobacter hormaechei]MCM8198925.1 hypothetical protein [Enterobacter hormaechei]MDL4435541.1 hypothetical protein [Enterobacter hormaechei]RTP23241.1 hypothetical protein EKN53_23740 [Enterobacter hormaechei]